MRQVLLTILILLVGFALERGAAAQVQGEAPYVSPMRDQCVAEIDKDAVLQARCEATWTEKLHDSDAKAATANKKFVIWAYAAIWAILTLFVVGMWLRQNRLKAEIDRLERELNRAIKEE